MAQTEKRIWDLPLRLTHWGLVISFFGAHLTSDGPLLWLHKLLAFVCLTLLIFRLLWGIFGSENARFGNFVRGYGAAKTYALELVRLRHKQYWGHNPLGALVVVAILGLMALSVTMGLFVQSDQLSGPWSGLVGGGTGSFLADAHAVVANWVLALVFAHIAAIVVYRLLLRDDLVKPMLTGTRPAPEEFQEPRFAPLWLGVTLFAISLAFGGAIFRFW